MTVNDIFIRVLEKITNRSEKILIKAQYYDTLSLLTETDIEFQSKSGGVK